jgi:DNA-binding IclR family transcriptional regulator
VSLALSSLSGRKTAVLETLRASGLSLTVTELADQIGLTPSSAFGAMKALAKDGSVEKGPVTPSGAQTWKMAP